MRFRQFFRRRRPPTPVLLPSLERLTELIERVVDLLDQVAVSPAREAPQARPPAPEAAGNPSPHAEGHVLLVPSPEGYRLLERKGVLPARGDLVDIEGGRFTVLRLGPSPLPCDRRRCVFLEREEPPRVDRTFDR